MTHTAQNQIETIIPFTACDGLELNLINIKKPHDISKGLVIVVYCADASANIFRVPVDQTIVDALAEQRVLNSCVQMFEMNANVTEHKKLSQVKEISQRIKLVYFVYGHDMPIKPHLVKPATSFPIYRNLYTGHVTHQQLIDMGSRYADFYLTPKTQEGGAF